MTQAKAKAKPNAFTMKPDVKSWSKQQAVKAKIGKKATEAIAAGKVPPIVICPENPRLNPFATLKEKEAWNNRYKLSLWEA